MSSFAQLASVTATTKRGGGIGADGLEIAYTPNVALGEFQCLPLDPVSPEIGQGVEGLSFREILQTSVEGSLDIVEGDILVVGSDEYPIRAVGDWVWPPDGETYLMLTLEDRK